ncbi:MAG: sigma-54 dependent transcriptional regulator [Pseudomonadota bacterium]
MMSEKPTVLIVEDSRSMRLLYTEYLREESAKILKAETGSEALELIQRHLPHVIVLDLHLPDMNGMDILNHVVEQQLPSSVVVVTGHGSVDVAVGAMRSGAFDFIEKPFSPERLMVTLRNAMERQRLSNLLEQYKEDNLDHYHGFIGASPTMHAVYRIIGNAAPSKATIFITGESGTGKEVCAEALHKESERVDKPFVPINCAAIPRDLMESEIFGHIKGAFTGAHATRQGAASRANGGTLFLDEICEMDLDLQTKLLRFIQSGTFQKVGSSETEKVDVRFICATNRDPLKEVEEGRFREDLYYRLHVIPIYLPPLRERAQDVLMIARKFLGDYASEENKPFKQFSPEVEKVFLAYAWPGNVRQLQNIMRNVVVLNDAVSVTVDMLPPPLNNLDVSAMKAKEDNESANGANDGQETGSSDGFNADVIRPLWEVERDVIEHAIKLCDDNIPKAAAQLEISASTIYRKRQSWQANEE